MVTKILELLCIFSTAPFFVGGPVYDRFPRNIVFVICLIMTGGAVAVIPWVSHLSLLLASVFTYGFFQGFQDSGNT